MESNFQPASQAPFNDTTSHSRHPTHQAPPDEPAQSFAEDAALNPGFVRRFIYFARHLTTPVLNESACQSIASAYADLRAKADERTLPVSIQCLSYFFFFRNLRLADLGHCEMPGVSGTTFNRTCKGATIKDDRRKRLCHRT